MARKIKIGLDYFPHSCSLDDELEYIIALHKEIGYYVYFRLLERIYNNLGYYINWDKKNIALFSNFINVDIDKINDIINDCLSEHLFNKKLHKSYNILTSKGIQQRYFEAIDRRKEAEIIKEYILLDNDYINKINVNINWLNVDKSTQSKVKESKVKESKVNIPVFDEFKNYVLEKEPNIDLKSLKLKYESWIENDWKDGNDRKIKNWKSKILNTINYLPKNEKDKGNNAGSKEAKTPSDNLSTEW